MVEDIEVHLLDDMLSSHGGSLYRLHIDARRTPVNLRQVIKIHCEAWLANQFPGSAVDRAWDSEVCLLDVPRSLSVPT